MNNRGPMDSSVLGVGLGNGRKENSQRPEAHMHNCPVKSPSGIVGERPSFQLYATLLGGVTCLKGSSRYSVSLYTLVCESPLV